MGILSLLTEDEFQERSRSSIVKAVEVGVLSFYIDLAESLLDSQELDKTKSNFTINMGFAVLKLAEFLVIQDDEQMLLALAGPFSQEKFGSYSYKIKAIEQLGWPPMVERILSMYRSIGEPEKLVITTRVFPEFKHATDTGFRPWHDFIDQQFVLDEKTKTKP